MIYLISASGSGSAERIYETTINHTGNDTGNEYTITHNLNTTKIEVFIYIPNSTGISLMVDYAYDTQSWGYVLRDIQLNSCKLLLLRWLPADNQLANKTATVVIKTLT